ncbi:ribosome silencing factor [Aliidongia dinghuensis]|nr:ribosome silencing factor [Aliidongia dinghuensis]
MVSTLDDGKAEEIVSIDLRGKSSIADHMVIASGRSSRQVTALAEQIASKLKDMGQGRVSVEGKAQGDWVLLDAGDVIIHIFRPEVREFYKLEKMWSGPSELPQAVHRA